MKDKEYVVISGAMRKRIREMMFGKLIAESYIYRAGDLGLTHPSIVDFWKNFHNNFKDRAMSLFHYNGSHGHYVHEKDDIPVLLYKGGLSTGGRYFNEFHKRDYFIVPLKEREFKVLGGRSLGEVKKEIKELYEQEGMKVFCYPIGLGSPEKALEKTIEEQWKKLALFHPNKNLILDIPIEVSERDISKERIEMLEQLGKNLRELEEWRRKPLDNQLIFDNAVS